MQVRLATVEDAAAISGLIRPLVEKYVAHEFSTEGAENLLDSMAPEAIARNIAESFRYHIAEVEGKIAGVVATADNRHLFHLFVAEAFQRQGIARRLWAVAKQACLDAGGSGEFTVNSSRYAVSVYKKLGFVELGPTVVRNGVVFIPMRSASEEHGELVD